LSKNVVYATYPAAIGTIVRPEEAGKTLHNFLHNPRLWRLNCGIIGDFFDAA
jgi:hypothetical protein